MRASCGGVERHGGGKAQYGGTHWRGSAAMPVQQIPKEPEAAHGDGCPNSRYQSRSAAYRARARFSRLDWSLTGNSVFAAAFSASAWEGDFSSSYSCAMIASMRSFSRILGQMRPPFYPLSNSGFRTPELMTTPVVLLPPVLVFGSKARHRPSPA